MHELIKRKGTGTPDEFARKLGISKSMLMFNLAELREMGALLRYDETRRTYCYEGECDLQIKFCQTRSKLTQVVGGATHLYKFQNPIWLEWHMAHLHCDPR
jgi:predicted transcriptional regulator